MINPWETRQLFGHDDVIQTVNAVLKNNRVPHAWLLSGPVGVGKTTLAFHIANAVLSKGQQKIGKLSDGEKNFQLIKDFSHPALRLISRPIDESTGDQKAEIPVDAIRTLNHFFHLTSAARSWRIAIVTDAECMTRNAQNALLKILEEPPPQALIILTTTSCGELLPTISSRCRALKMQSLDQRTIRLALQRTEREIPPAALEQAVLLADGSLGCAAQLLEDGGLDVHAALMKLLENQPSTSPMALQEFADQMARKAETARFQAFTVFIDGWLQNLIRFMAGRDSKSDRQLLQTYAARRPLAAWLEVWDNVKEILSACERLNLDRKLAVVQCLTAIMR